MYYIYVTARACLANNALPEMNQFDEVGVVSRFINSCLASTIVRHRDTHTTGVSLWLGVNQA